jgi:hypothetical protein
MLEQTNIDKSGLEREREERERTCSFVSIPKIDKRTRSDKGTIIK